MRTFVVASVVVLARCNTTIDTGDDAGPIEYPAAPAPPDGGYPSCYGGSIPEAGPCCFNFYCLDRPDGGPECPSAGDPSVRGAGEIFGQCSCGGTGGPYAAPDGGTGCCYIANSRGCM